jgi:hypothetical protein
MTQVALVLMAVALATGVEGKAFVDPVTRYFHISYEVPGDAPEVVSVACSWSPAGKDEWRPAKVMPLVSETGLRLTTGDTWSEWLQGRVTERRAAGLTRTIVFNPYPDADVNGHVDVDFRVEDQGKAQTVHLQADNSDVVYITDWSKVLQRDAISGAMADGGWQMAHEGLRGKAGTPLPQLTYPLDLRGQYAIFVCSTPGAGSMGLRLSGDERVDLLASPRPSQEVLWRWCPLDRQHLVLKQRHTYQGYADASIGYVKLVPLTPELVKKLDAPFQGRRDKTVAGYFEPYSWAFNENVQSTLQHREPLTAYKEAGIDLVDAQVGRFGMKVVYESRKTDQLIYSTIGDPIDGKVPHTDNVGRMQQYTNTLDAEIRYCRELGLMCHANFGATNCYPGTPLQGDFSKQHPDWMNGHALRYDVPEVREYMLSLVGEALEIGAPGISIDFCRYPDGVDKAETATEFMRSLRKLADEHGKHIPILVRFPATGVRKWECFDYKTWAREGLVDYLCPSNIQGRHMSFDIKPYAGAVKGTKCKLTPVVDGISWGPVMPGPYLWRVKQIYDSGADGVYIYQADDRVVYSALDRRSVRLLGSSEAVRRWWENDRGERPNCSKGIYITRPMDGGAYSGYERLRVWLEGVPLGEVQMFLDGKLINKYDGPPYTLGTEEYESDNVIPPGEHQLLIRAKDGSGWLEQRFAIKGNG